MSVAHPSVSAVQIAWLDASAGVAGDMLLGALLDAGADLDRVVAAVRAVDAELDLRIERTHRHQIAALKATVIDTRTGAAADLPPQPEQAGDDHEHPHQHAHRHAHDHRSGPDPHTSHRSWQDVRALVTEAGLPMAVRDRALGTFARLARAEGAVHGVVPDTVTFHEIGALDAIGEVVGVAAAMSCLGLTGFTCSTVTVGSGEQVLGQHGRIPIPGPAVVQLLRDAGAPVAGGPVTMEMTTPTGAALIGEYAVGFGPAEPMVITATGLGAGSRNPPRLANLTRILIGTPSTLAGPLVPGTAPAVDAVVIEANVDDFDPRLWPGVVGALMTAGASDAWLIPIVMKKGRPAHTLSVLCGPEQVDQMIEIMVTGSSTIGVRVLSAVKRPLDREVVDVQVGGHAIAVKIARWHGRVVNVQPEFDDVARVAATTGRPVKIILAQASAAAAEHYGSGRS